MYVISKDGKKGVDPYRIQKDEFFHKLHSIHNAQDGKLDLDMQDMAGAHMVSSQMLRREGVEVMSVEERIDVINEMTHAIGATTGLAQMQMNKQLEREKRNIRAGKLHTDKAAGLRAMLQRKS